MGVKARAQLVPGHQISLEEQQRLGVDGLLPSKIMRPADADDAARGLRLCDENQTAVVIWGGGTQIRLGSVPRRYDVAFSTERMTRVLEYEPADLTCGVQAGVRLSALHALLGKHGQPPPPDPPPPQPSTARRTLAANPN